MSSQSTIENWPTDMQLFETAKAKAPQHALHLDNLLAHTEQAMYDKELLDRRVAFYINLETMVAHEWPTDLTLFFLALGNADQSGAEELHKRWEVALNGYNTKIKLDTTIMQILDGSFNSYALQGLVDAIPMEKIIDESGYITPPCSPRPTEPPALKRILAESGAFDEMTLDPYPDFTEDDCAEYKMNLYNHSRIFSPLTLPQEIDYWARDLERLVAESKAIRQAPTSAFADLAAMDDDDSIPEVDIDAA
uniref:Uncharacterized protein n=1 Tax=viral metagenome TaxID=1070528 RepID=A0A6C0AME1_9ZZZZ